MTVHGRNRKRIKWICGIMAPVFTGVVLYLLWQGGAFLPRWIPWESGTFQDAAQRYEIVHAHRSVKLWQDGALLWTSPRGLKVQAARSCDIDHDGQDELILLCWRIGRYGKDRPFWVERNERSWSQHIAVYEYDGAGAKPKWTSSYIGLEVYGIWAGERAAYVQMVEAQKTDGVTAGEEITTAAVGKEENAVHPHNRLFLTDREGKLTCWFWDSWGFTMETTDVSFVAFGDNLLHEPIYQYGLHNDNDFSFLFENVKEVVAESDISVINQETPLTDDPARYSGYPQFGTPMQVGEAISDAGFDVVTCATNHALDQGMTGIAFTKRFFNDTGVMCLGIQGEAEKEYQPYDIIVRNGARIAMLNYTYGMNGSRLPAQNPYAVHLLQDEAQLRADLEAARADSDFVVLFAHWGTEGAAEPDDFQQKWTQIFLECGVDVVIGTHPHALQPYEMLYDDSGHEMLVYYSIGNYISAQSEKTTVKGGMASFTVSLTADGYRISEYGLTPLAITWEADRKCTVDFLDAGE